MYRDFSSGAWGLRRFLPTAKNFFFHCRGMAFVMHSAKIMNGFRQPLRLDREEPGTSQNAAP